MKSVIVPYDANQPELVAKIGGAVHAVGGPPATLKIPDRQGRGVIYLTDLTQIAGIVARADTYHGDWTVEELTVIDDPDAAQTDPRTVDEIVDVEPRQDDRDV